MLIDHPFTLLRRSLQANALFSGLSGLLFLVAGGPIASFLGGAVPWVISLLGLGLILYAVWLLMIARRPIPDRREVWIAIGLDAAWVLASAGLLIADLTPLTLPGKWAVGIVADLVAVFAVLQYYGLTRQQRISLARFRHLTKPVYQLKPATSIAQEEPRRRNSVHS